MNTDDTDQESGAGNQLDFRQQEEEGCAVSDGAFHPDGAAVIENNMFNDCQTETCAAAFTRPRFVDAIEALKDARQMFRRDTGAEVADKEFNAVFALFCADNDLFSALGVAKGVAYKVAEDLVNGIIIGQHGEVRYLLNNEL